jgi:hypothetical protein
MKTAFLPLVQSILNDMGVIQPSLLTSSTLATLST